MKASELRIGNWFAPDTLGAPEGHYDQITAKDIAELESDPLDDYYKPILLTTKILERCGFELDELKCWSKINLPHSPNILSINGSSGIGRGTVWLRNKASNEANFAINLPSIQYLHQLQNLFFAIAGEELELKF